LSGKHGRFNAKTVPPVTEPTVEVAATTPEPEPEPVAEPEPVIEVAATEPEPVAEPEPVVAEPAPEPVVAEPAPEPVVAEPEPAPGWEPTWTKTQLLAVSQAKGLSVTSANSKAEIIAALTAAG
jgi:outer membrane biosynthesis protein TonB